MPPETHRASLDTAAPATDLEPELPPALEAPPSDPISASGDAAADDATPGDEPTREDPSPTSLAAEAPATEPDAVLPAPYARESTPGFWRRIRLGRTRRMAREEVRDGKMAEIETRLGAIEARISSIDQGLGLRFDRVEQRFLQFWEMEEQLSQLTEITDRLEEIRRAQKQVVEAADSTRGGMRTLSLILAFAVLALAAALAAALWAG